MKDFRKNRKWFDGIISIVAIVSFIALKFGFDLRFETLFILYGVLYLILGVSLYLFYRVTHDLFYILTGVLFFLLLLF